jgi:hypothetical protein
LAILRQTTNVYPYGDTVDASDTDVKFTIVIDGDVCVKYSLRIYDYATGTLRKTYTSSLSSENYVYDEETLTISVDMTDASLGAGEYYWVVDLYWDSTNFVTTIPFPFYCYDAPVVIFSPSVPPTITKQSYTFNGLYTQAQNKRIQWWTMILYDSADNKLQDSNNGNNVPSYNSNIKYTFDGLQNGFTYGVQIIGETENGIYFETNIETFNVSYSVVSLPSSFIPIEVREDGAAHIAYNSVSSIVGTVTGSSSFVPDFNYAGNYGLHLDDGSYITFDVEITNNIFSKHLNWKPDSTDFVGEICSVRHTVTGNYIALGYNGSRFYLDRNGSVVYGLPEALTTNNYIIGIRSDGKDILIYYRDTGE